jgi:hypothetical protein
VLISVKIEYQKLLIEKSTYFQASSQRTADGGIAAGTGIWNGLIKVEGKVIDQVMSNGLSPRYQGNAYVSTQMSGCLRINLGGTAEVI